MLTFKNRTALVTGAGRGIGRAIAETLAHEGVAVICVSKSADSCAAAAAAITQAGGKARALAVDVADGAAVARAAEALLAEIPVIDILVNNAGITRDGLLFRMSDADWNDVIATNLTSCFHWTKHLARPMTRARWGRIVNITSVSGIAGNAGQANYSAAKAGMIGLTKALAREFAARSVTVNAVAPGFIKTDMTSEFVAKPELAARILEAVPLKRFGDTADIASMCAYLCSEESGYITGQVFTVDGGMAM
ncbi:MAG TPA: 3-oxoacyl-[acyl-carrier-protein] reductase [Opitutaceae bacterium]|nr:3-oxoacyl-[acyl-carrier-protein] reductase [Opitutaceae bacterium]